MLMPDIDRAIETCLCESALREHLLPLLAAAHGPIGAVCVTKAHRSASRQRDPNPLTFCCEVNLPGAPLRFFAKLYRAGASAQAALEDAAALHVPELDLLLWPWPHDPGLPQLRALLDPAATRPYWGEPARDVHTLRYEPEKRAVLRYYRADGAVLYAKTYRDARANAVARRFAWMEALSQQHEHAPRVAHVRDDVPIDANSGHTLWQDAARGTPLSQQLGDAQTDAWVPALARAIAVLHAAPLDLAGNTPRSVAHWLAEVGLRRKKIVRALPDLAPLADATAHAIEQGATRLPQRTMTLIHGDFHIDQAWFDGQRIVLFDFDEFALGDPMEDLAEFVVKLPCACALAADATLPARLLGAYAQAAPQHFCRTHLAWHMAVQQLVQASRAFVFQVADWREQVQQRLARAHHLALQLELEVTP
jgi:aminoglycoside phosphotransferase (APT) family kinase protein